MNQQRHATLLRLADVLDVEDQVPAVHGAFAGAALTRPGLKPIRMVPYM